MTFLLYLCKVLLCSGILLGYYWLFLRNKRFHHYNRFYLLGTLIVSVLLPFIKIGIGLQPENGMNQVVYQTLEVLTVNYGETDGAPAASALAGNLFTLDNLLYAVYSIGIISLLALLMKSVFYVKRLAKKYPYEIINDLRFYNTVEPGTPFSFFRSVFWNQDLSFNSREGQQIFRHELFHIRQKHSLDVLLAELITALFWCNPFFHIIKKELKAIHEFLADQYAVSENDRYAYAELLVLQTMQARAATLTHPFFQNHIKRRITMITNLPSSKYTYWSRVMALPLSVLLFCSIALHAQQPINLAKITALEKPITVVIDAGHGGSDNGASSADGKWLEKDMSLQISKRIAQLAPGYKINVIMTRTTDDLPGGHTNKEDGLRARTKLTAEAKADLFISIHVSAVDEQHATKKSGFEVFVTNNNEQTKQGSVRLGSALLQSLETLYTTDPVIKQRNGKNIWVLEQAPCPAALIECGYITNPKDVEFINANQEAVARKILEGIVQYTEMQAGYQLIQDNDLLTEVTRHFNRNIHYPSWLINTDIVGEVYFSLDYNAGKLENLVLHKEKPVVTLPIHELVVVGYPTDSVKANTLSAEETQKFFDTEVRNAFKRPARFSDKISKETEKMYFKMIFRLSRP